ncbi:MAG: hypothetical protein H6732_00550 [Alphaproteobacteria bacterium]|nr:hypothetical protein [Alphaproteobacteria bacterium]
MAIAWSVDAAPPPAPSAEVALTVRTTVGDAPDAHRQLVRRLDQAWDLAAHTRPGMRSDRVERPELVVALTGPPSLAAELGRRLHAHPLADPPTGTWVVRGTPAPEGPVEVGFGEGTGLRLGADPHGSTWATAVRALARAAGRAEAVDRGLLLHVGTDPRAALHLGHALGMRRFPSARLVGPTLDLRSDAAGADAVADARRAEAELALAEGRFDEAAALLSGLDDPRSLLQQARTRLGDGQAVEAEALARRAAHGPPEVAAQAVRLLLRARAPLAAWEVGRGLAVRHPDDASAWLALAEACSALDRDRETTDALEAAVRCAPDEPPIRLRAARHRLACHDAEVALVHLEAGLVHAPADPELLDLAAEASVLQGRADAVERTLAAAAARPEAWRTAVVRLWRLACPERVSAVLPPDAGWPTRARLALWGGRLDEALVHAARAPDDPEARLVGAAVAVCRGEPASGLSTIDALLAQLPTEGLPWLTIDTLHTWRAEALRALGRTEEAGAAARAAMASGPAYSLAADLARLRAVIDAHPPGSPIDPDAHGSVTTKLQALHPSPIPLKRPSGATLGRYLDEAAARLGPNRSPWPTVQTPEGLQGVPVPPHPRHLARTTHHLLRCRPVPEVIAAYEALQARFPDDPTTRTYRGEVLLWLGRYAEAAEALQGALDLHHATVWAWIGLGASQLLAGDPARAVETFREGVHAVNHHGPTIHVYRGEARRLLGEHDKAVRNLDLALRTKPARLSAWVVRAFLAHDAGDPEPAAVVAGHIARVMPSLHADARETAATHTPLALLQAAHALMRGNRSSSLVSWVLPDDTVRFGTWRPPGPAHVLFPSVREVRAPARPGRLPRR